MKLKAIYNSADEVPEDYKDLYAEKEGKWIIQVDGIKLPSDVAALNEALRKERADHKASKTKLQSFIDVVGEEGDAETLQTSLDELATLKAAGDKGDVKAQAQAIADQQINAFKTKTEREAKKAADALAALTAENEGFKAEKKSRKITDALRDAATKSKVIDSAVEDLLMYERVFDIDDAGNVVTKDGVGATPGVDPAVWLTEMQDKRSHWWPVSEGGGARGGNRGSGSVSGNNPWTAEKWNITEQGNYYTLHGAVKAEQMAKSAGTTIGGPMPAKKA